MMSTGRAVDCQEVKEREACGGADHDVRRVADERCGATNVRRNDFRQEERNGAHLQHLANGVGNGADKQNGGDVVQECGKVTAVIRQNNTMIIQGCPLPVWQL